MRGDRATEIAGEQNRAQDRGRRHRIEHGADDGDDPQAARERFAGAIAHSVHRVGNDRPRHQLDGAVEHQEYDDQTAENSAAPARWLRDRHVCCDRGHGLLPVQNGCSVTRRTTGKDSDRGNEKIRGAFPSPVVGEGGSLARSDGEPDEGLSPRIETPHPALRATFSHKGRRKRDCLWSYFPALTPRGVLSRCRRSRCMRMWAASAEVLASAMARSKAIAASSLRPSCIKKAPRTPKK